ncbi:MAG: DUF1647 domain-containing protein [Dongiaceae bacterium]
MAEVLPLTVVTGASSNHFRCLCNLLSSIDRHEPGTQVIVYDLGLQEEEARRLRGQGRTVRTFEFDRYPPHFGRTANLTLPYSWKPVIVHDLAGEFPHAILWLDAGDLVHERLDRVRAELASVGIYTPTSRGTIADWTHPLTLKRLNAGPEIGHVRNRNGAIVGFGTTERAREILLAWRDAAMNEGIMLPDGWTRELHRGDQAVLSVLIAQARQRQAFQLADSYLGISIHHDRATADEAARLMVVTAEEARQVRAARMARRRDAARTGRHETRPARKKKRGLARLWSRLKRLVRRALAVPNHPRRR